MTKQVLISTAIYFLAISLARAEKLDLSAHNSIIQKLEAAANVSTDDSMVQSVSLHNRLADLYAERARLLSMEDEGQGAQKNKIQIETDRRKSISLLKKLLPHLNSQPQGNALLQTAHLHELLNQPNEALKIYKSIENQAKIYDGKTNAVTHTKLGDYAFAANEMTDAQRHFEKSLTYKENTRQAYAQYRLAWVHFNQGQTLRGEKMLLNLLQDKNQKDASFLDEVSHDLAIFMARNNLVQTNIKTYFNASPENLRKRNLIFLAQELDRTAKKQNALKVWALVGTQDLSFEDQVDRQIQMTRIEYDLGHLNAVNSEINKSILLLKKSQCRENANCTVAQQNLRKIISDWARAEDRKVSTELITALKNYTLAFEDYELSFWAATLASKKNQHQDAFTFYLQASTLLKQISERNVQQNKLFELSLVGGIEMAQFAKNPSMKLQAYERYLEFNPNGVQKNEVRYQIAQWYYDQNQWVRARDEFKILALDTSVLNNLREKSAELCLDANVILKQEYQLEQDSLLLSKHIKTKNSEFLAIYRKSVLNQTAQVLNHSPNEEQLKSEQSKLQKIEFQSFTGKEKQQLTKNKMEIAYRLKDLESLNVFSRQLLQEKGLDKADQQKAYQYLAWIAEVRMNFKEALKFLSFIQPQSQDLAAYHLKVAMLKEFTSQNAVTDYEKFMAASRDINKKAFAAHQIVLQSKNPKQSFTKYESILNKKSDLYASAAIFTFEKNRDSNFAHHLMKNPRFAKTPEGELIRHQQSWTEFQKLAKAIAKSQIRSGSDQALKKALVQRNDLLKKLERFTNQSIARKDTVEQLIYLPFLAQENQRLANEILALPAPRHLKKEEKQHYEAQVKTLVAPYEKQSLAITEKTKEIWKQATTKDLLESLSTWAAQIKRPGQKLALQELSLLKASVQNVGLTSTSFEKLSERSQKVSSEASGLQMKIYKNPFDFNYLEKMKSLQSSLGSGTMVAYLDSRIDELNSRGR